MSSLHATLARAVRFRVVAVLSLATISAPDYGSAQSAARQIALGEAWSLHSAILNEDRELQIALPETYGRTTIRYPVLFLLDGSSHLLHASATARFLASARNRIPEMIVVAIPNTNRNRDMTPGPGAATFERVLAEELIPWVERTFRAAPEQILVGHSLSASFAVHALLNRPELFDAYVAASAPLWRYDSLAADARVGLPRAARAGAAVYLTVGEHENERLRDGVQRFAATLRSAAPAEVPAWSFLDMRDEDHSSTPQRTLYNALEARYAEWRFPFFEDQTGLDGAGGLAGLEAHYQRFATRFGYDAPPPEARLVQVARMYLAAERHDDILRLARAYARPYPGMAEGMVNQVGYDQLDAGRWTERCRPSKATSRPFRTRRMCTTVLGTRTAGRGTQHRPGGAINAQRAWRRRGHRRTPGSAGTGTRRTRAAHRRHNSHSGVRSS